MDTVVAPITIDTVKTEALKPIKKDTIVAPIITVLDTVETKELEPIVKDTIVAPSIIVSDTIKTEEPDPIIRDTVVAPVVVVIDTIKIEEPDPVIMDTIVTPVVAITDTIKVVEQAPIIKDTIAPPPDIIKDTVIVKELVTQPNTLMDTTEIEDAIPVQDTLVSESLPVVSIMDTIPTETIFIAEDGAPIMDTIKTNDVIIALPKETVVVEEIAPVMDTVRTTDVSLEEPRETAVVAPTPEPTKVESKPVIVTPIVKPSSISSPVPSPSTTRETEKAIGLYYAVQVAAGSDKTIPSNVSNLSEEVYIYEEGGMNKFRVGHYQTLNEVVNSKNAIFKKGITDVFIVAYLNGNKIGIGEAKKIEAGSPSPAVASSEVNTPVASKPVSSKIKNNAEVFLAVQVGANVSAADPIYELAKYEHKLKLRVKVIQGSPVRYYTGQTKNRNEAEQTLSLIKAKGIDGAFLIGISNGERVNYQAALKHLGQ